MSAAPQTQNKQAEAAPAEEQKVVPAMEEDDEFEDFPVEGT